MALDKVDLVLHEGKVLGHPESDSVAITAGKIAALGRFADFKPLVGPRTRLIRLAGRLVAPGFIDCHLHFMEGAAVGSGLSVMRCRTIGDLLADLRVAAARTPPGNWLRAFGCDETLIQERRGPTREELDQVVGKSPLRLRHQTLHASWLNSRAINLLGMEKPGFSLPDGAFIARDPAGRMTGFVAGMEEWLSSRLPRVTPAELEARARVFSRELASHGVTAFTDATVRNGLDEVTAFAKLVSTKAISQRASVMVGQDHVDDVPDARRIGDTAGLRIAGVKFMDVARWQPDALARKVARALEHGADCAFHCTEVEELDAALHAIDSARRRVGDGTAAKTAYRIEHGGMIPPEYPQRLAALDAWVVSNPSFIYYRGAKYAADPGLIPFLYRARSLMAAGVNLAAGSDAPVTPPKPLTAIAAAIARVSAEGYELAPEERLTAAEAFALFTVAASRLTRISAGEITPGRLADLIVLPTDPLSLRPAELVNVAVEMTIVDGRVVYEHGRPAAGHVADV